MTIRTTIVAFALFTTALPHAVSAQAGTANPLPLPANKIVGLWSTAAAVGPCGGQPVIQVTNNLLFHAGGTLTENIAPTPDRNQGLGTWSYEAGTGWRLHLRFDRFADGVNAGYTTVDRALSMSRDGRQLTGPVRANFYAPDGTLVLELCGEATSTRLQ